MTQLTEILREAISPQHIIGPGKIVGPEGVVEWEYGIRTYRRLFIGKKRFEGVYLRTNDTVILDHRYEKKLKNKISSDRLIILDYFCGSFTNQTHLHYDAAILGALSYIDFENQNVLDLGSNTGILSLYAMKKGASSVYAIEKEEFWLHFFRRNINHNNLSKTNIEGIKWDIEDLVETLKQKENGFVTSENLNEANIVMAHIGPAYDGYLSSTELLDYTPKLHTFVGGGFNTLNMKADGAISELEKRGFSGYKEYSSETQDGVKIIAFVMERK